MLVFFIKLLEVVYEKSKNINAGEISKLPDVNVNIKMYKKWKIKMYIYPCYASAS